MNPFRLLTRWFARKSASSVSSGFFPVDVSRRLRQPTPHDLLNELKNTAWTCATINASVCASLPPRLYVMTLPHQKKALCPTRELDPTQLRHLRASDTGRIPAAAVIEEVLDHPLLTLLRQVNPVHNAFDLWEMSQISLEVHGSAYWLLDFDPFLKVPSAIWILPAHQVTPRRHADSSRIVDAYEYRGQKLQSFSPDRIVHFRCPDPRDPYAAGLSPLKACFEQVALISDYSAMKRSIYENRGIPSVMISPKEPIGPDERDRLEKQWQQKFQRGGQGRALVAESGLEVKLLSQSMGDLAALADMKATKEDIANAFHIPMPFLSGETNLANMQAADHLHKSLAIVPRIRRRDEKLNEQLVPKFDPSGRLFFATPDPVPANQQFALQQEEADLKHGVRTVNEIRAVRGLAAVPWGDSPLSHQAPG